MDERRSSKRIPVTMWVDEVKGQDVYFHRTGNVSEGGLFLDGSIPHPRGTRVQLKLTLPGLDDPVQVKGEIVSEPDESSLGMHVKFVDLDDALRDRLRDLIKTVA